MTRNKQANDISRESEKWGQEKFSDLTEVVKKNALVDSLATSYVLQQMLKNNIKISRLNFLLKRSNAYVQALFFNMLGLHSNAIHVAENFISEIGIVDSEVLSQFGEAFFASRQYK